MTVPASAQSHGMGQYPVSVMSRLDRLVGLLRKWNTAINLVAPSSLDEAWSRHVVDSAQIFELAGERCRHWADLGSGAGFPGLVVALVAKDLAPDMRVTLVESDQRKAEFLRTVSRETNVHVTVHAERIEAVLPLQADVVSARALAPLPVLCGYAERHLAKGGRAVFLKGARAGEEVQTARRDWRFSLSSVPSRTDPHASVLVLEELCRV